jgi:hypothetical protein
MMNSRIAKKLRQYGNRNWREYTNLFWERVSEQGLWMRIRVAFKALFIRRRRRHDAIADLQVRALQRVQEKGLLVLWIAPTGQYKILAEGTMPTGPTAKMGGWRAIDNSKKRGKWWRAMGQPYLERKKPKWSPRKAKRMLKRVFKRGGLSI